MSHFSVEHSMFVPQKLMAQNGRHKVNHKINWDALTQNNQAKICENKATIQVTFRHIIIIEWSII